MEDVKLQILWRSIHCSSSSTILRSHIWRNSTRIMTGELERINFFVRYETNISKNGGSDENLTDKGHPLGKFLELLISSVNESGAIWNCIHWRLPRSFHCCYAFPSLSISFLLHLPEHSPIPIPFSAAFLLLLLLFLHSVNVRKSLLFVWSNGQRPQNMPNMHRNYTYKTSKICTFRKISIQNWGQFRKIWES